MAEGELEIWRGLPVALRGPAARIYYAAFGQKMAALGNEAQSLALLECCMAGEQAIVALRQGALLGLAGLAEAGRPFVALRLAQFVHVLGPVRGALSCLGWRAFTRWAGDGELILDALAGDPAGRGTGVGTRLLGAVQDLARERGFALVSLDVVDTNPRARQLYERVGFRALHTHNLLFARSKGFSAATTLARPVK